MSRYYFAVNSPPLSFTKSNLYTKNENIDNISPFIKAVSDAFFLSNNFRKSLCLYFCTSFKNKSLIIEFDGSALRYLGPSFFSAAHLIIRVMNHLSNPTSKEGKLTPGLTVHEKESDWIFEKHSEDRWIQITNSVDQQNRHAEILMGSPILFLFNFNHIQSENIVQRISWNSLEIDEQIILTNHYIESVS